LVFVEAHGTIPIATLSGVQEAIETTLAGCIAFQRAMRILESEILDGITIGYRALAGNILIPWPGPTLEKYPDVVKYQSDVVSYNYSCQWTAHSVENLDEDSGTPNFIVSFNSSQWQMYSESGNTFLGFDCDDCHPGQCSRRLIDGDSSRIII
jgi:hypothetical protein